MSGSAQWLGQICDSTVRQLSRDWASGNITKEAQERVVARFTGYGTGQKLL